MISGRVSPNLEAIIRLNVQASDGQTEPMDFKIDTGFSDFISLPIATVARLGLSAVSDENVQIANGTSVRVAVHTGIVIWEGKPRRVDVHAMGADRLVGMRLLVSHDLSIRVQD